MNEDTLIPWLLINRLPGLTPIKLQSLLQQFEHPKRILMAPDAQLEQATLGKESRYLISEWQQKGHQSQLSRGVQTDLAWLQKSAQHSVLTPESADYPEHLTYIPDPAPVLFVIGPTDLLSRPQIAMVGSRQASTSGLENARWFATQLSQRGLIVTSGLAIGVDGAAHTGSAVDAFSPTIAVLGSGLDRIYPARHRRLADQILASNGCLVSEYPIGIPPRPHHFPRRNRIIAGLSLGVLVVEAATGSGSLITAELAIEQGREVFAVPGNMRNPVSQGCHQLIQQGAKLVTGIDDILDEFPGLQSMVPLTLSDDQSENQVQNPVLNAIDYDPTPVDLIADRTGIQLPELSSALLELELLGQVKHGPGGYCRL